MFDKKTENLNKNNKHLPIKFLPLLFIAQPVYILDFAHLNL
jgi:hypothetical protein